MKLNRKVLRDGLKRLQSRIGVDGLFRDFGDDLPLRSELFNASQLEAHAESLANWHQIDAHPGPDRLLARLASNERVLLESYQLVNTAVERKHRISPAGEWLLDNFYLIEEQIRTARRHLPKQYSHGLPRLFNGPSAGYPLVYDLALELISHVDGRIDAERLRTFIAAYQLRRPLTLGELWAVPIMIRQALIENLRRVAARVAKETLARTAAREWSEQLIACAEKAPHRLILLVADMARPNPQLSSAFVAETTRRLQGHSSTFSVPLTWIEQRLAEQGQTIEHMVQAEGQQQAIDQVSISNSIGSLRELEAIDWKDFVEALSLVEQTLRTDPANVYRQMDFQTRDQYRRVVEVVAKHSPLSEQDVASRAVELARNAANKDGVAHRTAHVGYYLIDGGLSDFRRASQRRPSLRISLSRIMATVALPGYLGTMFLLAAAVTAGVLWLTGLHGASAWVAGLLLFFGSMQLGSSIVNWLTTLIVPPQRLPRLDFSRGIPAEYATLVVVPTMLTSPRGIGRLLEGLEVRFLANRDETLRFCLLTDFGDAPLAELPEDAALLELASAGIDELNAKYPAGADDSLFFLLHRPRLWNPQEQAWMGRERKRGKLSDLNALLRGGSLAAFSRIVGRNPSSLTRMKFVITLDTDTLLPRDAAQQLAGTLAHTLNRARVDEMRKVVVEGYGILQPGVATSLDQDGQSWFGRLNCGEVGVDPYTRSTSDVYQDLFREGSFIGKGIYDIDAFVATMERRFPDNQILSHDLLEGCYARSGLLSDVHVYESYPARYNTDISRRHRWIRGDWQIASWLLPVVPGPDDCTQRNPLSLLSRWKILDNLRRSLVPAAVMLLLVLGWMLWPPAWVWTAVVAGIVLIPPILQSIVAAVRAKGDFTRLQHLSQVIRGAGVSFAQAMLSLAFLPYEASVNLDAVVRTVCRMLVTRRRMLEWKTANDAERDGDSSLKGSYRAMAIAPGIAIVMAVVLAICQPAALAAAAPLFVLWLAAPWLAWWLSRPGREEDPRLTTSEVVYLHGVARKTWHFFETFVGPEDHWLPPDNYQEQPVGTVAHRTSPTNIGVSLLSNLAASDFGYIPVSQLLIRTAHTLQTMDRLERYHGHFLNWYDTQTLQPLFPKYVSTVDSGNLAGHLLTLRSGLLELPDLPILSPGLWSSLEIARQALREISGLKSSAGIRVSLNPLLELLERTGRDRPNSQSLIAAGDLLRELATAAAELTDNRSFPLPAAATPWLRDLEQSCRTHHADLLVIAPWLAHSASGLDLARCGAPELSDRWLSLQALLQQLDDGPTLISTIRTTQQLEPVLDALLDALADSPSDNDRTGRECLQELRQCLDDGREHAVKRLQTIQELAGACNEFADVEYDFLYDSSRRLLAIGFNVSERRRDDSFYDLLASESRLGSFVAIAQGRLKQDHWFALGRLLTTSHRQQMLLSWSGSMFEYLMPLLVMPTHRHTLLDQTYHAVVERQRQYGRQRGVPWGISESGYNSTDAHLNYQYRAFGVPGLGFKRGLADDLVIAPYATIMALMVAPRPACANLQAMDAEGFTGEYGFYEAVDYTRSRLARDHTHTVIRSYMAHHQGMSLLALVYRLLNRPMQRRFAADPQFQATMLLLQERIPHVASFYPHATEATGARDPAGELQTQMRVFSTPNTSAPEVHLLSNGRYHVMVTNSGGGYSQWKGLAVTRWREDATRDNAGSFCYLRDVTSGAVWSTTHQPTLVPSKGYHAIFSQARAEFRRRDHDIKLHSEIAVSPEDDIEIRRVTLTNRSKISRTIELTSYAEVVLAPPAADATHPAFSNLFVQTEIIPERQAILCTRRPRSHQEQPPWMLHLVAVRGNAAEEPSYETDRLKFIGRRHSTLDPEALQQAGRLSNTAGPVLDPIVAIRQRLTLAPDETVSVDFVTGMAETREAALPLIDRYRDRHLADRVLEMAWTHGQVVLRQLNATEADAQLYGRLASSVVYMNAAHRAVPTVLAKNQRGQSGLWGHGISGDLPIVLLRIGRTDRIALVRQLVQAHAYWRLKGLAVDLVIWNDGDAGYRQELQDLIIGLSSAGTDTPALDRPGGIFVRRAEQLSDEDRILLQTVARVVIVDSAGTLTEQLERHVRSDLRIPELIPVRRPEVAAIPEPAPPVNDLLFFNGFGGFTPDGREYVIRMAPGQISPAPWVNVLANPHFGTVISESGGAYTWAENAHEFRLTPWHNDPVTDACGEAFYLRDEESGQVWSPMPQPIASKTSYVCRHGFGYSVFEHTEHGIRSELWVYVATDLPVKYVRLKVFNISGRTRRLSTTGYVEWVLGEMRNRGLLHVVTEIDPHCGALLARNPYSFEFASKLTFFTVSEATRTVTGDRAEFLGRNGSTARPAAMKRQRLSNKVGPGLDSCGAIQTSFELADGREREVVFTLGVGHDIGHVRHLVDNFRSPEAARRKLDEVWQFWNHTLGAVHVETPDPAVNFLTNGWLLYQTLACRFWARSGYYQSGGAIGFRDQLQDVAALLHAKPQLIREHLLLCAAHQFSAGDVQHWWHPPAGRGVRTHFSDDFLWLALVTCRYVTGTGDTGVLDEIVPFLEGRSVNPEEDAYYDLPTRSEESATLYEHCVRAITRGLSFGEHGLPLIGGGDWNDGMNLVGEQGRGESVWLAFFLYEILGRFADVARSRGDELFAERCQVEAARLQENIEQHAWDGEWYRRAYFDNGEPLGSASNAECQIDSLPQSWSVLSGAGDPERSLQAMHAVNQRLVRRDDDLIQLFDPPFDKSHLDPGYIKGYVPGVRENGGQYTHAAIWTVMAFAKMGDHQRAWELFSMINPVNHASTRDKIATYKVEPYVVAADVYAVAPHIGRGGWTWYTGSASWMYRLILESLLGVNLEVDRLRLTPCLPPDWKQFTLHYRFRETLYHITVLQPEPSSAVIRVTLDDVGLESVTIPLVDDHREHQVTVLLG
ncbi:GH36-type glycosyl hydrolase domain-containing protein [Planctellipticum variicoloris]|uniref:GH36-type glycosyl hydrolase domain-containing protein n=1 Tax=Planctellipticum variicoloris TaxID=3064265 RepID=UPI003AF64EB8